MQSLDGATTDSSKELDIVSLVTETVLLGMRMVRKEMRAHRPGELTVPQFRALTHLNHHAGSSLSHLAEHAGLALPSMSKAVDCMVRQGLVTRVPSTGDRRRVSIQLTQQGRDVFSTVDRAVRDRVAKLLAGLTDQDRQALQQGVGILRSVLTRDD